MIYIMWCCRWMLSFNARKGKEPKVPYYASAAAVYDGNLLYVTATYYMWWQLATYDGNLPPITMQYSSYTGSTLKTRRISIMENLYIHFFFLPSFFPSLPYAFEPVLLLAVHSTHSTVFNLIWFVLISCLRADDGLLLVIASTELLSLLIYLTSAILRLLYD